MRVRRIGFPALALALGGDGLKVIVRLMGVKVD